MTPFEVWLARIGAAFAGVIVVVGVYRGRYVWAAGAAVACLLLAWAQTPDEEHE